MPKVTAPGPVALETYWAKRDFEKTPEPSGRDGVSVKGDTLSFCIQKHDATHLHYDFRLELDGVLKSWAVAKGPSFIPAERRLAVQVEDHPLGYGGFEGIIPQGQYGGGTVMLWDRGTWEPLEDPHAGLKKGAIKFVLNGEKLTGHWTLVRMPPRPKDRNPNWLLIKEKDQVARPEGPSLPDNDDESVISKRTLQQIAAASDHVWQSGKPEDRKAEAEKQPSRKRDVKKRVEAPGFIQPELCTLADAAPAGGDWLHEIKFDGYRVLGQVDNNQVTLFTRRGLDWTGRFREIGEALQGFSQTVLLDGEVVVQRPDGTTDFSRLQERLAGQSEDELTYCVFDLLHFDGVDYRDRPLIERKEKLKTILAAFQAKGRIFYSEHVQGSGTTFLAHGCKAGLEGIISKPAVSLYRSGRAGQWLKVKCGHRQEFVIGGFVPPTTGQKGIGSLSVGYYDGDRLVYAGRIGTGYSDRISRDLRQKLDPLSTKTQPFNGKLPREAVRGVVWTRPELVAEIAYSTITGDGMIRHGAFKGLREDKPARDVTLDRVRTDAAVAGKSAKSREETEIGGVRISHPDKIIDSESGLTKGELAVYYLDIADWIMPWLADRPLSIVRCPEGTGHQCFFQRHVAVGLPPDVYPVNLPGDEHEHYLTIRNIKGLLSLVQVGALEIHPWSGTNDKVDYPDKVIFDLDPDPSVGWQEVVSTALECRDRLAEHGLNSFVKTTGGKGLHIVAPLDQTQDWNVVKPFCREFAFAMAEEAPDRFVAVMSKKDRKGRIFIDYMRNDRTATAVAPYSTRARTGAPVATCLSWKELSASIDPRAFDIQTVRTRLRSLKSDPWKDFHKTKQALDKAGRQT